MTTESNEVTEEVYTFDWAAYKRAILADPIRFLEEHGWLTESTMLYCGNYIINFSGPPFTPFEQLCACFVNCKFLRPPTPEEIAFRDARREESKTVYAEKAINSYIEFIVPYGAIGIVSAIGRT
jgi:hypothetical protein